MSRTTDASPVCGLVLLVALFVARSSLAEEAPAADPALAALEKRVHLLEQANERLATEQKRAPVFKLAPGAGLSVSTVDGRYSFGVRARAVVRETLLAGPTIPTTNELNVRTVRLMIFGNVLSSDLHYYIQLAFSPNDFEPNNPSPIFDAFVEYGKSRDFHVRLGQYFVPFDRARTIREYAQQFADRPQVVNELTLNRDTGITVYSNDLGGRDGRLGYFVGIFGGEGRNRFGGQAPGFLYVARFVIKPWGNFDDDQEGDLERLRRPRMAIGFGGAYNQNALRNRSTQGTDFTLGTFDYAHGAADLVFKLAGFSLLTEVLVRHARWNTRTGVDASGLPITEFSRSAYGYLVQAGMMVHRLVEVVARWEQLVAWPDTDPTLVKLVADVGKQAGAGLNLYLNGHLFKFQADYFFQFGDIASNGRHQLRFALDASF